MQGRAECTPFTHTSLHRWVTCRSRTLRLTTPACLGANGKDEQREDRRSGNLLYHHWTVHFGIALPSFADSLGAPRGKKNEGKSNCIQQRASQPPKALYQYELSC